ncbi:hypothetical protein EJ05DRAFT_514692 [Pseudovirgaria hyperparasitica]|uniref:Tat pathway signal sequence n=1 Tax=Pseudovirgaria hyperparasitica TaxID=470096 RepID=A0A6A6VVT9_9PEZI|nr:uncharacterized protein EJ05DRAFT_514692 [Pseudovirgaria hyperparasitica]KAF2753750.1 hypothetical protein EJ05DRAFT_514692 [Pseudovirgaria hyperparasitica]
MSIAATKQTMSSPKYEYTSLSDSHDEMKEDGLIARPHASHTGINRWGFFAAGVLSTLAAVFVVWVVSLHVHIPAHNSEADALLLLRKPHFMTHATESIYAVPQSVQSDEDWRLLFPLRGARFTSEDEARPFTLSVFHQLHCLASIRRVYFDLQTGEGSAIDASTHGHIRHCIDFLRQVVMCNADRTKEIYGTDSFEAQHMCYDWDEVLESTEPWTLALEDKDEDEE